MTPATNRISDHFRAMLDPRSEAPAADTHDYAAPAPSDAEQPWPRADLEGLRNRLAAAVIGGIGEHVTAAVIRGVGEQIAAGTESTVSAVIDLLAEEDRLKLPGTVAVPASRDADLKRLRAERDAATAQTARFRQGAEDIPPDDAIQLTPGQLWAWLLAAKPERRLSWLGQALRNAQEASTCHMFRHQANIDELHQVRDRLARELADARDAATCRLDVVGIEPGKTYVIRLPDVTRLDELDRITATLRTLWPSGAHIAVLAPGATLETGAAS